ncbi:hypothetical protein [Streptacidiphilus sp. PAMC 29251]
MEGEQALAGTGDLKAGKDLFERAYRAAELAEDPEAMAVAALGTAGLWVHGLRSVSDAALLEERLVRVLGLLDPQDVLALRVRARLAAEADYPSATHARVQAVLEEARAVADPAVRAEVVNLAHQCLLGPDHASARQRLSRELVGWSFRSGRYSDLLMGLLWQAVDHLLEASPHSGRRLAELREQLSHRGHLAVGYVVSAVDVMLAIRAGDLDGAETLAKDCLRQGLAAGDVDATVWYNAQLVAIRWYQGCLVEVLPRLERTVHSPLLSMADNSTSAALAVAAVMSGDRRRAASLLASLCGPDLASLPRSSGWLSTMYGIVEAAHLLDDADVSADAYELLRPYAELPMLGSIGIVCFGSSHHALGVAALSMGDLDRAVDHFRTAVQRNLALAHWPAVIASRRRLAQALLRRGRTEDAAVAQTELEAAEGETSALSPCSPPELGSGRGQLTVGRFGRRWQLARGGCTVVVEDSVGMFHLSVLIANPGREIPAVDLVTGLSALGGGRNNTFASTQPMLDHAAIREYRQRLKVLQAEIAESESGFELDDKSADRARVERDWILSQLTGTVGIGGRVRQFSDGRERSRISVSKAIRRTIDRIAEVDPALGQGCCKVGFHG